MLLFYAFIPVVNCKLNVTVLRCSQDKAPRYLADSCQPVSEVAGRRQLRSARRHQLTVSRYQLNVFLRRNFSSNSLPYRIRDTNRGAGTNLKVGATGPARSARKNVLVVPLHFLALKVQLVVSMSAFVMVRTVLSVSCLLFFYSRCPPCSAICKSGGHVPPVPHGVGATGYKIEF